MNPIAGSGPFDPARPIHTPRWLPPPQTPLSDLDARGLLVVPDTDSVLKGELSDCSSWEEQCQQAARLMELGARVARASRPGGRPRGGQEPEDGPGECDRIAAVADRLDHIAGEAEQALGRVVDRAQDLERRIRAERKSPAKGTDFEARVFSRLLEFAEPRRDAVEWVGARPCLPGHDKKGDILYRLHPSGTTTEVPIALELKARRATQSGKDPFFLDQLDDAMEQRGCRYGIVVVRAEENSLHGQPLFPRFKRVGERRFVVMVDDQADDSEALELAILLVESQARAAEQSEAPGKVDLDGAVQRIDEGLRDLASLRTMREDVGSMIRSERQHRKNLDRFEGEIRKNLYQLRQILTGADRPYPSPPEEPSDPTAPDQIWRLAP